jgi:hypothetical protein
MAKQAGFTAKEARLILQGTEDEWIEYIRDTILHRAPHLEPYILKFPRAAYAYAWYVLRRRWKEAERVICTDPWAAYNYTKRLIQRRWPNGEAAIMREARAAYWYAISIIQGRFQEAEPVIDSDPRIKKWYDAYLEETGQGRK